MHIILLYSVENVGNKRGIQYGILDQTTSFCKILDLLPYRRGGYWIHKTRVGNCADWTRIVRLPDIRCIFMLLCLLILIYIKHRLQKINYCISGAGGQSKSIWYTVSVTVMSMKNHSMMKNEVKLWLWLSRGWML